jgi:hemerythrin-like domain-containing protein
MTTINEPLAGARDMFAEHRMFRREFGLMPGLVRTVAAGDTQRATLVADHIALVSGLLNQHHSGEDKHIWALLWERCLEECASLVDVMEDQHHAIHTCLLQVSKAAESWRDSASADARGVLANAIDRLVTVTTEHLALEEERVVPLIEKHVAEARYAVLTRERAAYIPRDKLPAVFGLIMYYGDSAVIDMIVAEMPVEVQPAIKDLAVKAYAAYAEELYGTASPPRLTGLTAPPVPQPRRSLRQAVLRAAPERSSSKVA